MKRVMVGFGFTSDWLRKVRDFLLTNQQIRMFITMLLKTAPARNTTMGSSPLETLFSTLPFPGILLIGRSTMFIKSYNLYKDREAHLFFHKYISLSSI